MGSAKARRLGSEGAEIIRREAHPLGVIAARMVSGGVEVLEPMLEGKNFVHYTDSDVLAFGSSGITLAGGGFVGDGGELLPGDAAQIGNGVSIGFSQSRFKMMAIVSKAHDIADNMLEPCRWSGACSSWHP